MQISSQKPVIPVEPERAPHFYQTHDENIVETQYETAYRLPLDLLVNYMHGQKDDNDCLDTICCIAANAGLAVNLTRLFSGETDPAKLFVRIGEPVFDGQGKEFVQLPVQDMINLFVSRHQNGRMEEKKILTDFLNDVGLEINETRILKEFCPTCGK